MKSGLTFLFVLNFLLSDLSIVGGMNLFCSNYDKIEKSLKKNEEYMQRVNNYISNEFKNPSNFPRLFLDGSGRENQTRGSDPYEGTNTNDTLLRAYNLTQGNLDSSLSYSGNLNAYIESSYDEDYYKFINYKRSTITIEFHKPSLSTYNYDFFFIRYKNDGLNYYGHVESVGTIQSTSYGKQVQLIDADPGHYIFYVRSVDGGFSPYYWYSVSYSITYNTYSQLDLQEYAETHPSYFAYWESDFLIGNYAPTLENHDYAIGYYQNPISYFDSSFNELINEYYISKSNYSGESNCISYGYTRQRIIFIWNNSVKTELKNAILNIISCYTVCNNNQLYTTISSIGNVLYLVVTNSFNNMQIIDLVYNVASAIINDIVNTYNQLSLQKRVNYIQALSTLVGALNVQSNDETRIVGISFTPKLIYDNGYEFHLEYGHSDIGTIVEDYVTNIINGDLAKDYPDVNNETPYLYGKLSTSNKFRQLADLLGINLPVNTNPSHC